MRIQANYHEIRNAGRNLQRQAAQYEVLYTTIMSRMKSLQSAWQGSDFQAFAQQIEALKPKMVQLKRAIDLYADLLLQDAAAYEQLQRNRAASARRL